MTNTMKINGQKCEFNQGDTILQVARRSNIHIPTLCFLEGASPTGACRICIVEVKGAPGPVAACSTPAVADMEVLTETPRIIEARKTVIELLLISGNHNCAVRGNLPQEWSDFQQEVEAYDQAQDICVAYGECQLQALAYKYQATDRTVDRIPTKYPLEYDDLLIGRDFSRCILCGRCVQACCEIQVNNALSHGYRGNIAKIVVRGDKTLPDSDCVYCGECVQACPVGSLFEKRNRYDYRMWDVKNVRTTCYYCGVGCQMDLSIRGNKIVKVNGLADVQPNLGRLCFKGRFGFDFLHSEERLTKPMIRMNGKLVETSWDTALDLVAEKIKEIKETSKPESLGCLVSTKYSNEDLFQTKKFFNSVVGSKNVTHFEPGGSGSIDYEDLQNAGTIIIVGLDISRENPVAATFIKQAVLKGVKLIVVDAENVEIAKFAHVRLDNLSQLAKEIDDEAIVVHEPGYDMTPVSEMKNIRLFSLTRENNTLGAYLMGIHPQNDFNLDSLKFLYSFGGNIDKNQSFEFLVVQDIFPSELTEKADVVLPVTAWVEYDGTYISSDFRINKVKKAIDPPIEVKETWRIFNELAKRLGYTWESDNTSDIWDKEISKNIPLFEGIKFTALEEGQKLTKPPDLSIETCVTIPKNIKKLNSHKILASHCQDLQALIKKRIKEG